MNRRELLGKLPALAITASCGKALLANTALQDAAGTRESERALARPTPQQIAWQNLELGMFVHIAPNTWQDSESDNLSTPPSRIDPSRLNTEQWAETALSMGARYIVFVAKHAGGFCMWQTKTTDYGIAQTPWKNGKGDVVAEISASCRKHGLRFGLYCSPRDDHFGTGVGGICKTEQMQARYDKIYREQLTELFTRYGELVEIWFDGSTVTPVADLIHRFQPKAMVFQGKSATIRWVGNEQGFAPYPCWNGIDASVARLGTATALDSDPDGSVWLPNEVDVSIRRPDWFWSTTNADKVLSTEQLLSIYYRSVGRGAQLLVNIPPNREGLMDAKDRASAAGLGTQVKQRFGSPLASTHGSGTELILHLPHPRRMDTVILQENIALGERVRAFTLEGRSNGRWVNLGSGTAIGHKRIQPVPPQVLDAVRLRVTQYAAEPSIGAFLVFDTGAAPPADWALEPELWAPDLAGQWQQGAFSLQVGKLIDDAGQYVLRFKPSMGKVEGIDNLELRIGGFSSTEFIHPSPARKDELLLDITGLNKSIVLTGRVRGADAGSVLLIRR